MAVKEDVTLRDLFRAVPVRSTVLVVVPVLLAVVQLANSYVNELSPLVAGAFALVMVSYATVLTRYHLAQFRRRQLERKFDDSSGRELRPT